jgi:hypothetical protein
VQFSEDITIPRIQLNEDIKPLSEFRSKARAFMERA